jgi:ferredoxin-nitrite reductase
VDVHEQKQPDKSYVGIVCPVGRLTSDQCRGIAKLSSLYADGTIRLTVWQNLLIPNIPSENMDSVLEGIESLGLEWRGSSVRAGLIACTGSAGCKYAGADTKRNAMELAAYLDGRIELDQPINIHFTGCHHSCAQHAIGDIGLIGTKVEVGEEMVDGYHILLGGRTGVDNAIGVKTIEAVPDTRVPVVVESILEHYLKHRSTAESFADFSRRVGWNTFTAPELAESTLAWCSLLIVP